MARKHRWLVALAVVLTIVGVVVLVQLLAGPGPLLRRSGGPGRPSGEGTTQPGGPEREPVTVAFIADGGMSHDSRAVLRLVERENADLLVYSGDFDYHDDPQGWSEMLNETLGPDFPIVATVGNHDLARWGGYRERIRRRTARAEDLHCSGDLGLHSTCTYRDVTVVQSSDEVCSIPSGDDEKFPEACGNYSEYEPERYVRGQLERANTTWKICSWHYPNHDYQVGEKNGVSVSLYDSCRRGGGDLIVTGHDHAYARTYPMSNFTAHTVASRSPPYAVGDGHTIALVTGASGHSYYDSSDAADADWWANTRTSGKFGAFFCSLYQNGTGTCYFETVDGEVVDTPFGIRTGLPMGSSTPTSNQPGDRARERPAATWPGVRPGVATATGSPPRYRS